MFFSHQTIYTIIAIAAFLVLILLLVLLLALRKSKQPKEMDSLEGHDFEQYCASILENHSFCDVQVTKGSGDYGIDILAEKDGVSYAIQCKRYDSPIGVDVILKTYGGRVFYDCMVGVVMTNQYFTAPAVEAAQKLNILLWDRGYIDSMLEESS